MASGQTRESEGILPGTERERPPVSVPLLIAAGIVALVELVLARFFSHAESDAPRVRGGVSPA